MAGRRRDGVDAAGAAEPAFTPPDWDLMFETPPDGGLDWGTSSRLGASLADYTGEGVRVGIIDDGFALDADELEDAFDTSRDRDLRGNDNDPSGEAGDGHGTWAALVLGAAADGEGGTGGAYDATLVGLRVGYGSNGNNAQFEAAFRAALTADADVLNCSFGNAEPFRNNYETSGFAGLADAQRDFAVEGRGGLGGVAVFSSGNADQAAGFGSAQAYGEAQYAGFSNHLHNIVVGGFGTDGEHAWFARGGESLTCVAQAVDVSVPRTDGGRGHDNLYGTSFAAPQVTAAVAQMLEANAELGARDVREILALSSRLGPNLDGSGLDDPAWAFERNGADTWNGGGLKFASEYGFGALDAVGAVRLAETWQGQATWGDVTTLTRAVAKPTLRDRGEMVGRTSVATDLDVDAVELDVKFDHGSLRDLAITLVSPSGTESVVFDGGLVDWEGWGDRDRSLGTLDWQFTSNRFWGENARGTWEVKIEDRAADGRKVSQLTEFEIRLHGDGVGGKQYVYTDDFSEVVGGAPALAWTAGVDTLNAAAVTSDSLLSLRLDTTSTIDGVTVAVGADCRVENAVGGDGDDILVGQGLDNLLLGGRGDDTLYGNDGLDRLAGGDGADRLYAGNQADKLEGGAGEDMLDGQGDDDRLYGDDGDDRLYGGDGADRLSGGRGDDTLAGGLGDDRLYADDGADRGYGDDGNDEVVGGAGDDRLSGGLGNDSLRGDGGVDRLYGDDGNDRLSGGAGADLLTGGSGDDSFVFTLDDLGALDRVLDFAAGEDRVDLGGVWNVRGLVGDREDWVRLTDELGGCVVAVDADGLGPGGFAGVARIDGATAAQVLDDLFLA